ncbi:type II secretion system protein [Paraherbaspirillum soli]|uniref:Type II secretion system protein n=1 Tax=Paraherbaspirillum soli TaxID=631222 RepID=A0ABW0MFK6_9BURK
MAYIAVLLLVTAVALFATGAAQVWAKQRQRQQEQELLFIGDQYRQAIASYYRSATGSRYPRTLAALLSDDRVPYTLRHLRKLYRDPMTGDTEWGLIKSPDGGVMGVYSMAEGAPQKQGGFPSGYEGFAGQSSYKEWAFVHVPAAPGSSDPVVESP